MDKEDAEALALLEKLDPHARSGEEVAARLGALSSGELLSRKVALYGYHRRHADTRPFLDLSEGALEGSFQLVIHLLAYGFVFLVIMGVMREIWPLGLPFTVGGVEYLKQPQSWTFWAIFSAFGLPAMIIAYYDYKRMIMPNWSATNDPKAWLAGEEAHAIGVELWRREGDQYLRYRYGRE